MDVPRLVLRVGRHRYLAGDRAASPFEDDIDRSQSVEDRLLNSSCVAASVRPPLDELLKVLVMVPAATGEGTAKRLRALFRIVTGCSEGGVVPDTGANAS